MTEIATPMLKQAALVGRQAIFDRHMEVFGYELLYRDGKSNRADIMDGDEATARVMVNTFLELGIDQIAGNNYAFLNLTASFFLNSHYVRFSLSSCRIRFWRRRQVSNSDREGISS